MAKAQTGMSVYGIPQPFTDGTTNTFYYSKNAPTTYTNTVKKEKDAGTTVESIRETLFKMEYIWKHGGAPGSLPTSYPADTSVPRK